jgi:hypothetical protein
MNCWAPPKGVDGCGLRAERAVVARLYRFHCLGTDGAELDPCGCWMSSMAAIRAHADRVALTLMSSDDDRDWFTWTVDVRDTSGRRVFLREFTKVRVSE